MPALRALVSLALLAVLAPLGSLLISALSWPQGRHRLGVDSLVIALVVLGFLALRPSFLNVISRRLPRTVAVAQPATSPERECPPAARSASTGIVLTGRQQVVLDLIAQGRSEKEIAQRLGVSERTIEKHAASLRQKLHAQNSKEAVAIAYRMGLLTVDQEPEA